MAIKRSDPNRSWTAIPALPSNAPSLAVPHNRLWTVRRFHRWSIGLTTGLSHSQSSVVSLKSSVFEHQNSNPTQTFSGADRCVTHLSGAVFLGGFAQRCGSDQKITDFLFLKTFFLRGSSNAHFGQPLASEIAPNQCFHFLKKRNQGNRRASDHVFQTFKTLILPWESRVETLKSSLLAILAESWTGHSRSYFV